MYKREFCLIWKIENFSFCPEENGQSLCTPNFNFRWLDNYLVAALCLYPRGYKKENENFISCALYGLVKDSSYFSRVCKFEIIGASGKILQSLQSDAILKTTNTNIALISKLISVEDYVKDLKAGAVDTLTIRCTLCQNDSNKNDFRNSVATTKMGVTRESLKIKAITGMTTGTVFSTRFEKMFLLSIQETQGNLVVKVSKFYPASYKACFVECSLTMLRQGDIGKYTCNANHFFSSNSSEWIFPSAELSRELQRYGSDYIVKETCDSWVRFYCEFSFSNGEASKWVMPETQPPTATEVCQTLKEDLRILLDSKKLCDVKLKFSDQVLEAHKNILVARSPVFASMFDNDMSETHVGIVDIVDADVHIFTLFLNFLYTDTVEEMSYEVAKDLLLVAEKYQVQSLKLECVIVLEREISVENACDILTLADAVNHEKLKNYSIDFIIANSTSILSSPAWFIWMKNNMVLATIILSKLSLNLSTCNKN